MPLFDRKNHPTNILSERIEKIISNGLFRWIENREYRNPYDCIEEFATVLGVTQGEVADYLRFHLDIKYCTLRRLLRIRDAAIMLLLHPYKPLRHIGHMVGYLDPSNFRSQFREYTDYSPDDWRKRIIARGGADSEVMERGIRDGLDEWIEKRNYRKPEDSIGGFAEGCGATEAEVEEYLHNHLNTDYKRLRRLLRIQDAVLILLLFPEMPLIEIGGLVGYVNRNEFRIQFTKYTNHNPRRWHKRIVAKREMPRQSRGERRPSTPILRQWCPIFKTR